MRTTLNRVAVNRGCLDCGLVTRAMSTDLADVDHLVEDHPPRWRYMWGAGIEANLFRNRATSSGSGIPDHVESVVVVGVVDLFTVAGPHEVAQVPNYGQHRPYSGMCPPVVLVRRHAGAAKGAHYLMPVSLAGAYRPSGWSFGGMYARGDSVFDDITGHYYPVPVHHRREDDFRY